jgi:NTE family protein
MPPQNATLERALSPVDPEAPTDKKEPTAGIALCLSGGGYRAMLFHLGALWRLNELGYLPKLNRISSVSGGSITAGVLAAHWSALQFDATGVAKSFSQVVDKVRKLAGKTIDQGAILGGLLGPGSISDKVISALDEQLFNGKTLADLPEPPRFVINATNVQSGALWRFMKPYMRDWRVGEVRNPNVRLAVAVAASAAFPPFLSPIKLELDPAAFTPGSGHDLQREPFTSDVILTDGGVYDNLGLETAWKRYKTILVGNGGGKMAAQAEPKSDWARHSKRVLDVIDNQVRSLRQRQVIGSFEMGIRTGTYWGIRTDIADYGIPNSLPCAHDKTMELAEIDTRLKRLEPEVQERLINWGYAVSDAAMRRHVDASLFAPDNFPYQRGV